MGVGEERLLCVGVWAGGQSMGVPSGGQRQHFWQICSVIFIIIVKSTLSITSSREAAEQGAASRS